MTRCFSFIFSFIFFQLASAQFTLTGRVINNLSGEGLADCVIYLDQSPTPFFTQDNGAFVLADINAGEHELRIVKQGFDELKSSFTLSKDEYLLLELFSAGSSPKDESIYKSLFTDEVIVQATRAAEVSPTTKSTITAEELAQENLGQDLTYLLENETSVVSFSDGGVGIGYTGMRIRGSDMSRINFTINGVPYNDPESQAVFLVNVGDLSSSIQDIQIQRGVGSSTNGAAAFGASVNINTNTLNDKPYAELNNSFGSFASMKNTFKFGSGLIQDKFTFDAHLSKILVKGKY
jgi:iron complex outermembrane recepter protein